MKLNNSCVSIYPLLARTIFVSVIAGLAQFFYGISQKLVFWRYLIILPASDAKNGMLSLLIF
jgi:hypothetical protein